MFIGLSVPYYVKIQAMNHASTSLPKDVKSLANLVLELRDQINDLQSEVTTKNAKIDHQSNYIDQLVEAIALAKQQYFGSRSQKIDTSTSQLSWLFNEAEAIADHETETSDQDEDDPGAGKKQAAPRKRRSGGRKSLPDHFPHIEIIHSLDETDCHCDHCQGQLKELGSKTSKQVELIPMTINVIVHIKKTYHCPHCKQGIKAAKLPPQPIPGSMASPGAIACVVGNKYVNGTPLYRQEKDLQRHGLPITRSTLASWMIKAGILIQPLINLMNDRLLIYDIVMMDETRCQVLKEPGKTPQSRSYMWCRRGGPPDNEIILFDYAPSRSQQVPIDLLGDYSGYLQVDAYGGYNKVIKDNKLIRVGCWAHVMVKFKDAYKVQAKLKRKKTSLTAQAIKFIKALYKIEDEANARDFTVQQRHAIRQARSKPLLDQIRKWLTKHLPLVVKQSALGKAMHYMNDEWDTLTILVTDGRLRLDNNAVENAIRPFVIGRKNSLFSDTVSGAKASANLYSLIETAKANGLEPYAYLKQVFTELPKATCVEDIEALLPFKLEQMTEPKIKMEQAA